MFDAGSRYDAQRLQRAEGAVVASFRTRDGMTVLDRLWQSGCLKARFPRPAIPGWADVVLVNSSGGIAGGDTLRANFAAAAGARMTISTQAAERFYRARGGDDPAMIETRIEAAEGTTVEWLPQETIIYDGAAVSRRLQVECGADASFLGLEMLVFGRALMGESVRRLLLHDRFTISRNSIPLVHDAIRIDGDPALLLARDGIAGGMRAVATLVCVAADAEAQLSDLRQALDESAAEAGASAENGLLVARLLAGTGAELRRAVVAALGTLRDRPLPRVWLC
jgi:urease accessory protein